MHDDEPVSDWKPIRLLTFKETLVEAICTQRFSLLDLALVYTGLTIIGAIGVILIGVFT